MSPIEKTVYCMSWEVKYVLRELKRDGFYVMGMEYATCRKVVIVAKERFKC